MGSGEPRQIARSTRRLKTRRLSRGRGCCGLGNPRAGRGGARRSYAAVGGRRRRRSDVTKRLLRRRWKDGEWRATPNCTVDSPFENSAPFSRSWLLRVGKPAGRARRSAALLRRSGWTETKAFGCYKTSVEAEVEEWGVASHAKLHGRLTV